MTSSGQPEPTRHSSHDPLLVAAFVAGDLGPADARETRAVLSVCSDCAALADDLRSIAAATRALRTGPLPAPADRHFTLEPSTAARLRSGRWWRRLLRPFGTADAVRPAAGAFAALGLAGLLLTAIPGLPLGGAASIRDGAGQQELAASDAGGGFHPVDMSVSPGPKQLTSAAPASSPVASGDERTSGGTNGGGTGGEGAYSGGGGGAGQGTPDGDQGTALVGRLEERLPLVALSVGLLVAGLCLILLRRAARRLA
jgi:hypothetical protein